MKALRNNSLLPSEEDTTDALTPETMTQLASTPTNLRMLTPDHSLTVLDLDPEMDQETMLSDPDLEMVPEMP